MAGGDRAKRLEELFHAAADVPGDQIEAFLGRHCGDDQELKDELRALLREKDAETVRVLKKPLLATGAEVGEQIGRYTIRERLGTGGMGTVYLARQHEPVERDVALKTIRPGADNAEVAERFEHERQTLAQMNHPGIARMFDGGATDSGQPYFVMEYVPGLPITEYCDRHRLGIADRVVILGKVCEAAQHAHQQAVIHRDLKPTNVLVMQRDGQPVPKIIDFGIARAISGQRLGSGHTGTADVVGTWLYMSPEQADPRGSAIDTRADIYSLGAILYELLTGSPPFDAEQLRDAGVAEAQRLLTSVDPPKPSVRLARAPDAADVAAARSTTPRALERALHGDLDWITMKALDKERSRRYATASELRDDLERYLSDEPVSAGAPSATYVVRKFVRRHSVGVTISAGLLIALVAAVIVSSWAMVEARAARDEQQHQAALLRHQIEKSEAVVDFLGNALAMASRQEGSPLTVREMLDRATAKIGAWVHGNPVREAAVRTAIGRVYLDMGEFDLAVTQLTEAYTLQEKDPEISKQDRLSTLDNLIHAVSVAQGRGAAQVYIARAIGLATELVGATTPALTAALEQMRALIGARDVTTQEIEQRLDAVLDALDQADLPRIALGLVARVMIDVGAYLERTGKQAEGLGYYQRILAVARDKLSSDKGELATGLGMYGQLCLKRHQYAEALGVADELDGDVAGLLPPEHWLALEGQRLRGLALAGMGDALAGERELLQLVARIDAIPGPKTQGQLVARQALGELAAMLLAGGGWPTFVDDSWRAWRPSAEVDAVWWPADDSFDLPDGALGAVVERLQRAVAADDGDGIARSQRGHAYFSAGRYSMAVEDLRAADRLLERRGVGDLALLALAQAALGEDAAAGETRDELRARVGRGLGGAAGQALLQRVEQRLR